MKNTRKGFTLVELLIVIGIIGLLGSMAMIGGSEANNIAQASKIVQEFNILGTAMNSYYDDNRAEAITTAAATILTGIAPYMKNTDSVIAAAGESDVGKYLITVHTDKTWWLTYTLPAANTKLALILKNKALVIPYKSGHKDLSLGGIKTMGKHIPKYTEEFKRSLVTLYRNGKSQSQLRLNYVLSSASLIVLWLNGLNASQRILRMTIPL